MKLANQNAIISEGRVMESHRSLADWSNTLRRSWTSLFNYTKPDSEVIKGYPICVIKSDDSRVRRKRGARQYEYDYNYAGVAPTVDYTGTGDYSHYERPEYGRPPHHGPPHEDPPYEEEEEEPIPEDPVTDENGPVVNCVVVVNRKNKTPTRPPTTTPEPEEEYPHHHPHPHYPYPPYYPPPYGYPHYGHGKPMPPGHYPYPPPYYGYPSHHDIEPKSRDTDIQSEYSSLDPAAEAHYQKMLNEYYNHLYRLYLADASTHVSRQDDTVSEEKQYDDDDEESNDQYETESEQMQLEKADTDEKDI